MQTYHRSSCHTHSFSKNQSGVQYYEPLRCDALVNSRVLHAVPPEFVQQMAAGRVSETQTADTNTRQGFRMVVALARRPSVTVTATIQLVVVVVKVVVVIVAVNDRRTWRYDPRDVWRRSFTQ